MDIGHEVSKRDTIKHNVIDQDDSREIYPINTMEKNFNLKGFKRGRNKKKISNIIYF